MADTKLDEKAKRVRSLLSSYYGVGSGDGVGHGGVRSGGIGGAGVGDGGAGRVASIDSAAFDAKHFLSALVKGTRLDGLQSKYTEMVQEIKSLDSDMQMLVYENYSKFITATDTIRRMKSNVEGMGEKMDHLLTTVNTISSKSDEVNDTLSARRENIEELNGVRTLLKKLQVVFDLPQKLRVCIEQDALALAVKYYTGAAPILKKYGNDSLAAIAREVGTMLQQVLESLHTKLRAETTNPEEARECIELLIQVGEQPDTIQAAYLASRQQRLQSQLRAASGASSSPADAPSTVSRLRSGFLAQFCDVCRTFFSIFPQGSAALVGCARELFAEYFEVVKAALTSARDLDQEDAAAATASALLDVLSSMEADVAQVAQLVPEAELEQRSAEVVGHATRQYVAAAFARVQDSFRADLANVQASEPTDSVQQYNQLSERLMNSINNLLCDLQEVSGRSSMPAGMGAWEELVRSAAHDFLLSWRACACQLARVPSPTPGEAVSEGDETPAVVFVANPPAATDAPSMPFVLLLARLTLFVERSVVPSMAEQLGLLRAGAGEEIAWVPVDVARVLHCTAARLVAAYVEAQGHKLAHMVKKSFVTCNWQRMKEPRDVRMVIGMLIEELTSMVKEVEQLIADQAPPEGSITDTLSQASDGTIDPQVAALFTGNNAVGKALFTRSGILTAIVKSALKAMLESVRDQTMGRAGFQQVQLDVHFLRTNLVSFVDDMAMVSKLLNSIDQAAEDRSQDPTPMERSVMDRIMNSSSSIKT